MQVISLAHALRDDGVLPWKISGSRAKDYGFFYSTYRDQVGAVLSPLPGGLRVGIVVSAVEEFLSFDANRCYCMPLSASRNASGKWNA